MKHFLQQLKWQFMFFHRSNLLVIVAVVTLFYALIFQVFRDFGNVERLLTFLIFNDPALVGFLFIGIAIILEKDQEVLSALFVTPINPHIYILSKLITLSVIGMIAGLGMAIFAIGFNFKVVHCAMGIFSICFIFGLIGLIIVSYTTEILHYIMRFIPVVMVMSLPLLNYFELTDIWLFNLFPIQGGLDLIANSYTTIPDATAIWLGHFTNLCWIGILYFFAFKIFKSKVINA